MAFTKLPPGKALGADDLRQWAQRRNAGQSGVLNPKPPRKPLDAADRFLQRTTRKPRKSHTDDPSF